MSAFLAALLFVCLILPVCLSIALTVAVCVVLVWLLVIIELSRASRGNVDPWLLSPTSSDLTLLRVSRFPNAAGASSRQVGPHHKDPVPQLVFFLGGTGEWETGDGTQVRRRALVGGGRVCDWMRSVGGVMQPHSFKQKGGV